MIKKINNMKSFIKKYRIWIILEIISCIVELFFVNNCVSTSGLIDMENIKNKVFLQNFSISMIILGVLFFIVILFIIENFNSFKFKKISRSICVIIGIILIGMLNECGALLIDNFSNFLENEKLIFYCVMSMLPFFVPFYFFFNWFCELCESILKILFDFQNEESNK